MSAHKILLKLLNHLFLSVFSIVMIFPLVWMFFAAFKKNSELFGSTKLLPEHFNPDAFIKGWNGIGDMNFSHFFTNTVFMTVPTVLFTLMSCSFVAYGFARFEFPMKKFFFALMISTLMLPNAVIVIPRYLLFHKLGWLNSYLPFIIPALFACFPFFIFMIIQFIRGIPKEMDEAAKIDGCSVFSIYGRILLPIMTPALISAGILQLMWTWNDFFDVLIYIDSVQKYPLSLGIRMSMDSSSAVQWNQIMAMSLLAILPLVIIFFFAQRYFVEGISTTGLKG